MVLLNSLLIAYNKYKIQLLVIVICTARFSHITSVLKSLLWLPVMYRMNFKICCLTHRVLSLGEPYYLRSLLTNRLNSYSLRSLYFNPLIDLHILIPLLYPPVSEKFIMAFALFFSLHLFLGLIYLTLFVLLFHTVIVPNKKLKTYI